MPCTGRWGCRWALQTQVEATRGRLAQQPKIALTHMTFHIHGSQVLGTCVYTTTQHTKALSSQSGPQHSRPDPIQPPTCAYIQESLHPAGAPCTRASQPTWQGQSSARV